MASQKIYLRGYFELDQRLAGSSVRVIAEDVVLGQREELVVSVRLHCQVCSTLHSRR